MEEFGSINGNLAWLGCGASDQLRHDMQLSETDSDQILWLQVGDFRNLELTSLVLHDR